MKDNVGVCEDCGYPTEGGLCVLYESWDDSGYNSSYNFKDPCSDIVELKLKVEAYKELLECQKERHAMRGHEHIIIPPGVLERESKARKAIGL